MRIAVTGATGFIGRHVVAELARRTNSLAMMCRPSSLVPDEWAKHSVAFHDMVDPGDDLFERLGRPDALVHLAWSGLPNYASSHHFEAELPVQYRFLKSLVSSGLSRILVTGTCFEYGPRSGSLSETVDPNPSNSYGFAKDALRRQLTYLQKELPFVLTWARLFYTYGANQSKSSLYSQLNAAIEQASPAFDMSGGEQLRDFLPVEEVASHIISLVMNGQDNGIVNICSGSPISVRRLVEMWMAEKGVTLRLNLGRYPYSSHEPMAFWGDRTKLDECLAQS